MLRRLFWLVTGVAFGVTLAFLAQRTVRRSADRYRPERVAGDLAGAVRDLGTDLRAAVAEGRAAMAEREDELRGRLGEAPPTGSGGSPRP